MYDELEQPFTLVAHKITGSERHNSLYYIVQDLFNKTMDTACLAHEKIQQVNNRLQSFYRTTFDRATGQPALLLRLKSGQKNTFLNYECVEEHLTLDSQYIHHNNKLCYAHCKFVLRSRNGDLIEVRYYIDQEGKFLELTIKMVNEDKPLSDDDPIYLAIQSQISSRLEPFLGLFEELKTAKSVLIFLLSQEFDKNYADYSHQFKDIHTLNRSNKKSYVAALENLIKKIALRNRYDDNEQDTRATYFESQLSIARVENPTFSDTKIASDTKEADHSEPKSDSLSTVVAATTIPAPTIRREDSLILLIDRILELHSQVPEYELFIQHAALLNEFATECFARTWKGNSANQRQVQGQKARLPFAQFNIEDYFLHKVMTGDVPAVHILLPHISKSHRYSVYTQLLNRISDDTAPFTCATLFPVGHFLKDQDPDIYNTVLDLVFHDVLFSIVVNTKSYYVRMLTHMCARHNVDGFRFAVSQGVNLRSVQFACDDLQLNSLEACIYICSESEHQNYDFVRILLENGMNLTNETTIHLPIDYLDKRAKTGKKLTNGSINIPNAVQIEKPSEHDNLLLTSLRKMNVPLSNLLLEYSDLETLTTACMRFLVSNKDFTYRFCLSKTNVLAVVHDIAGRDEVTSSCIPLFTSPQGFAYIFYPSPTVDLMPETVTRLSTLVLEMQQRCAREGDANLRLLIDKLLLQAKQKQREQTPDGQTRAHALIVACACIWGQIKEKNLQDCKNILQIMYLQAIIRSRSAGSNVIDDICMTVLQFIDSYPNAGIRVAIQQEKIYETIQKNATGQTQTSTLASLSALQAPPKAGAGHGHAEEKKCGKKA